MRFPRFHAGPILRLLVAIPMLLGTVACAQSPTLSEVQPAALVITPNGDGESDVATISYRVGQRSRVTAYIEDTGKKRYVLRADALRVPAEQPYTLRFDGTVRSDEPPVVQRVLPDGRYRYVIEATPEDGGAPVRQVGEITVREAASELPMIEALQVVPPVVTPNEDARDDVAFFSYRLPITSTVSINLSNGSETIPFITDVEEGPFEQSHIWDGKRPNGALLPSGVYTYTVRSADRVGNVVQREGRVEIQSPGRTEAHITYADIAPTAVALGNIITVTVRVKNTGNVPIRTQGPASGHAYEMNVPYSAIDDQRWAEKGGGFWRVGLDYGGGNGYPYRWALSERPSEQWSEPGVADELLPGEEVTITGTLRLQRRDDSMSFFVGLIHEGVGFPEHRKAVTLVKVGF
jgi:hypothetical protein